MRARLGDAAQLAQRGLFRRVQRLDCSAGDVQKGTSEQGRRRWPRLEHWEAFWLSTSPARSNRVQSRCQNVLAVKRGCSGTERVHDARRGHRTLARTSEALQGNRQGYSPMSQVPRVSLACAEAALYTPCRTRPRIGLLTKSIFLELLTGQTLRKHNCGA